MSASASLPFVHLGARSEAGLGESFARVEELCWEAARDEQGMLALTDANSLARCPAFAAAAARSGLRPIFGAELNVLPYGESIYRGTAYRVRLLVETVLGWKTLVRLVNHARAAETGVRPPYISFARLLEDTRGLVYILGGDRGEITHLIQDNQLERIEAILGEVVPQIGVNRLYLELPDLSSGDDGRLRLARAMHNVARYFDVPTVAVPMVQVAHPADDAVFQFISGAHAREAGFTPRLRDVVRPLSERAYLAPRQVVAERYAEFSQAMERTWEIAQLCGNFTLPQPDRRFPVHDFHRGVDAESFIWNTAFTRAAERYGDLPTRYKERLNREFREIVDAGLANAVVSLVRLHEELEANGVQRGPGAGLFTNSVIASLLGLTRLDPLQFDLNFELSPGLAKGPFPLLELSIPANQEAEAVDALQRLFDGQVVPVGEWKTWKPIAVLERAAELLGKDGKWAQTTLKSQAFIKAREFAAEQPATYMPSPEAAIESYEVLAWIVRRMEGRLREPALHQGQYTFAIEPIESHVPQRCIMIGGTERGLPVSEWTSEELGKLRHGRLSFSHPSLLDLIGEATAIAREQGDPGYSPEHTPPDDPQTYKLLREGRTAGIEALESPGLRRRLRQGRPADLHSLIRVLKSEPHTLQKEMGPDLATILLAHVCAAIKAHKPIAFYAAALSQATGNVRRTALLMEEIRARNIRIATLDINYSTWRWSMERDGLRPGFMIVKGMTTAAGAEIVQKRRELHFADLTEVCQRTDRNRLRATQLRALVRAGAFDELADTRGELHAQLEALFPNLRSRKGQVTEGDLSFFDRDASWWRQEHAEELPAPTILPDNPAELLQQETDAIGYPLHQAADDDDTTFLRLANIRLPEKIQIKESGQAVSIIGIVGPVEPDELYSGALLADIGGCLVRARGVLADRLEEEQFAGKPAIITGIIEREPFQWRLDVDFIAGIDEAKARCSSSREIILDLSHVPQANWKPILSLLKSFPGETPISMEWLPAEAPWTLRRIASRRVTVCPLLEAGLNRYAAENWKLVQSQPDDPPAVAESAAFRFARRLDLGFLRDLITLPKR